MRYDFIPVRMALIKNQVSIGENIENPEQSYTVSGSVQWCGHDGIKHSDNSYTRTTYDPEFQYSNINLELLKPRS